MKDKYGLKDEYGLIRVIHTKEIMDKVLSNSDFTLFGMTHAVIAALRKGYLENGGPLPITVDSVEMVFKPEPLAKPYKPDPRASHYPDQYPQARRNHSKRFYPRELTESEKEDRDRVFEEINRAMDNGNCFAGIKIKVDESMESKSFRLSRADCIPRIFGWQNPQFSCAKSLDGKNIKKKKEKTKQNNNLGDIIAKRIKEEREFERLTLVLKLSEFKIKSLQVMEDIYYLNKSTKPIFEKIGLIAGLVGSITSLNISVKAIQLELSKLDSSF